MAVFKIASTDLGYETGNLSFFPGAIDLKTDLYIAANNAVTNLKQSLSYNGKIIFVDNNLKFPAKGILRVGPPPGERGAAELIYYDTKSNGVFKDLIRGFAGSRQNPWPMGSYVSHGVFAEHHNSVKDAIIQIETKLGLKDDPDINSLNGILKLQERRFLSPQARFKASVKNGIAPLQVTFQNFTRGPIAKFLWDFGDGATSAEESPTHTYSEEGIYTVKLNVITLLGGQGITTKFNYITVNNKLRTPFFYFLVERKSESEVVFTPEVEGGYTEAQYKEYRIVGNDGEVDLTSLFEETQIIPTSLSGTIYTKSASGKAITSIGTGSETISITCNSHLFSTGDFIHINATNSTPPIDGIWQANITGPNDFTIDLNGSLTVTAAGSEGVAVKKTLTEDEGDYQAIQKFKTDITGDILVTDIVDLAIEDTRVLNGELDNNLIRLLWYAETESESFISVSYAQKKTISDIDDPSSDTDDVIYSISTSETNGFVKPTVVKFIDQTDGEILQRYWVFDGLGKVRKKNSDGTYSEVVAGPDSYLVDDPNDHTIDFIYQNPGEYNPSLLILFSDQRVSRTFLTNSIRVS